MSAALSQLLRDGRVWRGQERANISAEATGYRVLDSMLPGGGWPLGSLCEIVYASSGVGELSLLLPLLARLTQAGRKVALLSPPHVPYAPALDQAGIRLAQVLVVDAPRSDLCWAAEQLLHARAAAVLLWMRHADLQALRRLQLVAEDVRGLVFLFHDGSLRGFSPAALRLRMQQTAGAAQLEILKCRGGAVGQSVGFG